MEILNSPQTHDVPPKATLPIRVYQEIELSLTESLIPPTIHVRQFDHMSRKVRCTLYEQTKEYAVPDGAIISCTGARPDGRVFQYSSETAPELVFLENGKIIFTITDFMTMRFGRYRIDLLLLSGDGEVIGAFSPTLYVERSANPNRKIATATYAGLVAAISEGLYYCDIDEEGRLFIRSYDGINLAEGEQSSTVDMVIQKLNSAEISEDGHIVLFTEDGLELALSMDAEGRLWVEHE